MKSQKTMKSRKLTALEIAERQIKHMSFEERITLMKALSASMDGPRFFTGEEVKNMMADAINQYVIAQANHKASGLIVPGRTMQ